MKIIMKIMKIIIFLAKNQYESDLIFVIFLKVTTLDKQTGIEYYLSFDVRWQIIHNNC